MTRKDYTAIAANLADLAEAIADTGTPEAWNAYVDTVLVVADGMRAENGRFDRGRFLSACGIAETPLGGYAPRSFVG